jgi:hypothetical protein
VALALTLPAPTSARDWDVTVSPWAGAMLLDSHLRDFSWDTSARPVWGTSAGVRSGRFAGGGRVWRGSTSQDVGTPSSPRSVDVALTGFEGIGEARMARFLGIRALATGSIGLVRMNWSPGSIDLDTGIGEPVAVSFEPVSEATFGLGLALRREVPGGFELAAGLERSWFGLDTAHRRGTEIVNERETFGNWTARVELSRSLLHLSTRESR